MLVDGVYLELSKNPGTAQAVTLGDPLDDPWEIFSENG